MKNEESIGMSERPKEDKVHRYEIDNLNNRIKSLAKNVNFLTVLCNHYAKMNGIKIDRYPDGTILIVQL